MKRILLTFALLTLIPNLGFAVEPVPELAKQVNQKVVKIFGAGGFKGATNYSTGVVVSSEGHILTIASTTLDTSELIVHLYDGRRMKATVIVAEPELDAALIQIKVEGIKAGESNGLDLAYFNIAEMAKRPASQPGDWVYAFSNQFEIAMRNEPVSITRGTVSSYSKLHGRRGIFDFPYNGDVYVVDAITNNPGSGGGALTDRRGNLIGIIGREIKNSQTETWINYAIPLQAQIALKEKVTKKDKDGKDIEVEQVVDVSLPTFVAKAMKGEYKPIIKLKKDRSAGGFTGIRFVPNVLERTPPYVEELVPGSPAAKAGILINDLISFVDGEPINSIKAFNEYMSTTRPEDKIRIEVRRGDNLQTIELKLDEWPKGSTPPKLPVAPEPKKN